MDVQIRDLGRPQAGLDRIESYFLADPDLFIVDADCAFAALLGVTRENILAGEVRVPLGPHDDWTHLKSRLIELAPGQLLQCDIEFPTLDDKPFPATLTFFAQRDAQGQISRILGVLREEELELPPHELQSAGDDESVALRLEAEIASRQRSERRLGRLLDFNKLLARINHAISMHEDEAHLLQAICDLAAEHAHLALAYIARPNADGRFEFLAASGRLRALDNVIITTDENSPWGSGSVGQTWRDGKAHFNESYAREPRQAPWHEHALQFDLRSNAALALYRQGKIWAVMSVYHEEEDVFDTDLRNLLAQIALDVSRGLDRLDLLAEEKRHRALRESLLTNAFVGIVMTRGRHIVEANAHLAAMLGFRNAQDLVGKETRSLYPTEASYSRVTALYGQLYATGSAHLSSASFVRSDGEIIACDLSAAMVYEAGNRLVVWTSVDVTARDALQEQVAFESIHDALTGLANRRALDRDLPRMLAQAERSGRVVAIGMLDLDDFKQVNDTLGHEAGDDLLRMLAERVQSQVRGADMAVRLGGDEFVVVFNNLDPTLLATQLTSALERIHRVVESPFILGHGQGAEVGMTMGIALYPSDAREGDSLIRQADAAMYQCKQHKHDRSSWWRMSSAGMATLEEEPDNDPFGAEASRLLDKAQQHFASVAKEFTEHFYQELSCLPFFVFQEPMCSIET